MGAIPQIKSLCQRTLGKSQGLPRELSQNKINLNPWNTYHPRVLDGGALGAFFLVYQMPIDHMWQDLPHEMQVGEHYDIFTSIPEMHDKIAYYLENPEARKKIGHNLQQLVRKKFTYASLAQTLVEKF